MSEAGKIPPSPPSAGKKSRVPANQNSAGKRKRGGRKPGVQNRITREAKEAFELAFDKIGGVDGLAEWARKHRTAFYRIYARLIPKAGGVTINNNVLAAGAQVAISSGPLTDTEAARLYFRRMRGQELSDAEIAALEEARRRPALEHQPANAVPMVPALVSAEIAAPAPSNAATTLGVYSQTSEEPAQS